MIALRYDDAALVRCLGDPLCVIAVTRDGLLGMRFLRSGDDQLETILLRDDEIPCTLPLPKGLTLTMLAMEALRDRVNNPDPLDYYCWD